MPNRTTVFMHDLIEFILASRYEINLGIQMAMATALIIGAILARRKRFHAHTICQSSVLFLNLFMIALIMVPSFRRQVKPHLAEATHQARYAVAAFHAGIGAVAELLGLYIFLCAATNILPRAVRFKRFKPWMRTELVLWWIVVLFGIGTYMMWNISFPEKLSAAPTATRATPRPTNLKRANVEVSNFHFSPKILTVTVRTTVVWTLKGGKHTVWADDGSFKSGALTKGMQFEHTFNRAGNFPYHCDFHGDPGGKGMSGIIKVIL